MGIYTYRADTLIIVGAGTNNKLQDALTKGMVINADTGRITINGVPFVTEGTVTDEQKKVIEKLVDGKIVSTEADDFRFADAKGNTVARISKEGVRTIGLKITNALGRIVGTLNDKTCQKIFHFPYNNIIHQENDDCFVFSDKNGNVIAKIDSDGIHAAAYYDKNGNKIG